MSIKFNELNILNENIVLSRLVSAFRSRQTLSTEHPAVCSYSINSAK